MIYHDSLPFSPIPHILDCFGCCLRISSYCLKTSSKYDFRKDRFFFFEFENKCIKKKGIELFVTIIKFTFFYHLNVCGN